MPRKNPLITCAETGKKIGGTTGIDVYKHTIHVFNLPDSGVQTLYDLHLDKHDERSRRICANLRPLLGEKE